MPAAVTNSSKTVKTIKNSITSGTYTFYKPNTPNPGKGETSTFTWYDGITGKGSAIARISGKDLNQVQLFWDRDVNGTLSPSEAKSSIASFSIPATAAQRLWRATNKLEGTWSADQQSGKGTVTINPLELSGASTKISVAFKNKAFLKQASNQLDPKLFPTNASTIAANNTINSITNGLENANSFIEKGDMNGLMKSLTEMVNFVS